MVRINGFLDLVHRPELKLGHSEGINIIGVTLPSPEDGNRSSV
jgi:hypothetical protein